MRSIVSFLVSSPVIVTIATAAVSQESGLEFAQDHMELLASHQKFLESMYWSAAILISIVSFLFLGLIVFFGFRTKAQIDEIVQRHFATRIKARVQELFDNLSDELIADSKTRTREAADSISDDLTGSNEAIANLEKKIEILRQDLIAIGGQKDSRQEHPSGQEADPIELAWQRMRRALLDHKFVWRSIERLALEARISPDEAEQILSNHLDEVRVSRGKSGRRIIRHLSREK